jgi:group I intron endonuclease
MTISATNIMIGIYMIKSPTGKIYIGQSIDIAERFKSYKYLKCKGQRRLYNSFKKYGVENHIFNICVLVNNDNHLNELERFYQDKYNVTGKNGLNCRLTETNDKSGKLSEETKNRISNSKIGVKKSKEAIEKSILFHTGRKRTQETKLNISNSLKGRIMSTEWKKNISKAKIGNSNRMKNVINILTNKIYISAKEAYTDSNYSYSGFVKCLNGHRKNNTNFKYLENE